MHLLTQLPTLLGVIVGAVLSSVAGAVVARSQWQRNIAIRWDERRLASYVEYLNEAKGVASLAHRIVAGRGLFSGKDPENVLPISADEGYSLLAQAEQRRSAKAEAVLLLGDTATIARISTVTETLWRLVGLARSDNLEIGVWQDAYEAYLQARVAFYESARGSMGVPHAEIPGLSHPGRI